MFFGTFYSSRTKQKYFCFFIDLCVSLKLKSFIFWVKIFDMWKNFKSLGLDSSGWVFMEDYKSENKTAVESESWTSFSGGLLGRVG